MPLLQVTPGEAQPAAGLLLVAGMVSSTSAQLVSYPLGLVRTRLQVRPCSCTCPIRFAQSREVDNNIN